MRYQQIADDLDISLNAVKRSMARYHAYKRGARRTPYTTEAKHEATGHVYLPTKEQIEADMAIFRERKRRNGYDGGKRWEGTEDTYGMREYSRIEVQGSVVYEVR